MNWQETLTQLEAGTVRAATQDEQGNWKANVEVKQAILESAGLTSVFDFRRRRKRAPFPTARDRLKSKRKSNPALSDFGHT